MRPIKRFKTMCLCTLFFTQNLLAAELDIPPDHPRLWFTNTQELNQAKQWYLNNPTSPAHDDPLGLAFHGLMTDDVGACESAVTQAVDIQISTGGVSSDSARNYGETALLVYDWCHPYFSPQQREVFTTNWNQWQNTLNNKPWGYAEMESNNYYWGYLRNGVEWGITSLGENPQAQGFIDHALDFRYQERFVNQWAGYFGKGGVPGEGTQYGRYMLGYGVVPLLTAAKYGYETYQATNFYRENLFYLIYATLPKTTGSSTSQCVESYWYLFPFNDDEQFRLCYPEVAKRSDYANVLSSYIITWPDSDLAKYAKHWLDTVEPRVSPWIQSLTPEVEAKGFTDLPLDYYAPGANFAYLRNHWLPSASVINLQLGVSGNVGHTHLDSGSFQIWQNGHWMSRETTAYVDYISSWGGGSEVEDGLHAVGHNAVLFEGKGQKFWSPVREDQFSHPNSEHVIHNELADGLPEVNRIHHHQDFFFAATDLSKIYRARYNGDACRYDWPYAESLVREFVYLRSLNVLVVLDRMESSSDSVAYAEGSVCTYTDFNPDNPVLMADEVSKTFLMHFLEPPQINQNQVTATYGAESMVLTTLIPAQPEYRIVEEGSRVGQHRLELDISGEAQSYFLNIIQLGHTPMTPLNPQLTETAGRFSVRIDDNHRVDFNKGMQSHGGMVSIYQNEHELSACSQQISVNNQGPQWSEPGCVIFADGFEGAE